LAACSAALVRSLIAARSCSVARPVRRRSLRRLVAAQLAFRDFNLGGIFPGY